MDTILKTSNLRKNYFNKKALEGIDIEIGRGKIIGLLGPNGSGKTTLMKIIAGLVKPSSGEILIDGQKPGIYSKSIVSYLPDINYLYKWMTVKDSVKFFKDFYEDFDMERCSKLLEFMKLSENDKVNTLSKGTLEKLNLTLVLSRRAKLYILDEPLGGIDINAREKIIDVIVDTYSEDTTMIISTHLVRDIERMFDEVAFIFEGRIILKGDAEDLRMQKGKSIEELYKGVFE